MVIVKTMGVHVGLGYDLHRLVRGRTLILGGVTIPFEKGLLGHSDADVLLHALCDALLGAAGLGDIGLHFPDTNPDFEGVSSKGFVEQSFQMISRKGFVINNIDVTIMAEAPKLAPYFMKIEKNICVLLRLDPDSVNLKATTGEGVGPIGRCEAIAAMCVASLDFRP